jgi:WD40 repeat protein
MMHTYTYTQKHEEILLEAMKRAVKRNGYITKHKKRANAVAFDPNDHTRVISAGDDGVLKFINRDTGTVSTIIAGHRDGVTSFCFSHDRKLIATASRDMSVWVWDAKTGKEAVQHPLTGHSNLVECVDW